MSVSVGHARVTRGGAYSQVWEGCGSQHALPCSRRPLKLRGIHKSALHCFHTRPVHASGVMKTTHTPGTAGNDITAVDTTPSAVPVSYE